MIPEVLSLFYLRIVVSSPVKGTEELILDGFDLDLLFLDFGIPPSLLLFNELFKFLFLFNADAALDLLLGIDLLLESTLSYP